MPTTPDTAGARLAVLTPDARGAVAVVRVWGPRALGVAGAAFRPARGQPLADTPAGRPRLGRVGAGLGDEVVAVVVEAEPPGVEIHCHGGPEPLALVVAALEAAGAERRQPAAWVRASSRSRVEAEARVDLARAPTLRGAEVLLEQAAGALEAEVALARALIEADPPRALDALGALLDRWPVGARLVGGFAVALAGRPNVGKSRLLNALAGYERAIVDPTPGTTRDVLTVRTALDGWPVELSDTAGLRDADDPLESAGIARARARHAEADLTLLVLDRASPTTPVDESLLASHPGALVVANKSDLPAAWDVAAVAPGAVTVSSATGDGLDALADAVGRRLVPAPPTPGAGVPFRPAHARHLRDALDALDANDTAAASESLRAILGVDG